MSRSGGEGGNGRTAARDEHGSVAPAPYATQPRTAPRTASEVFVENLLALVNAHGLSQAELARRARTPLSTINRVFHWHENRVAMSLETIESIARGLQVPVATLLTERGSAHAPPPYAVLASPVSRLRGRQIARQVGRLTEDFLQCCDEGRQEVLRVAEECAARADRRSDDAGGS